MARRPPTRLAYTPLRWVQIAGVRERRSHMGICLRRRPRHDVPCCCLTPLDPALPLVLVLCIVDLLSLRCAGKKIAPVIAIIITEPSWSSPHLIITIYYHHHHHRYHQQHCHPSPSSSRPSSLSAPFTPTLPPSSTASSLTTVVHDHHHRHRHRHHVFAIVAVIPCIITAIVVIVTVTLAILAQDRLLGPWSVLPPVCTILLFSTASPCEDKFRIAVPTAPWQRRAKQLPAQPLQTKEKQLPAQPLLAPQP